MIKTFVFEESSHREVPEVGFLIRRVSYIYNETPGNIYKKSLLNKILNIKVVLTSCFFMFLGTSQIVLADYQPPKDQKPPTGHSDSSGVRVGCKVKNERSHSRITLPITRIQQPNSLTPSTQQRQKKNR